jgi:hypothetical protein
VDVKQTSRLRREMSANDPKRVFKVKEPRKGTTEALSAAQFFFLLSVSSRIIIHDLVVINANAPPMHMFLIRLWNCAGAIMQWFSGGRAHGKFALCHEEHISGSRISQVKQSVF